jgi:hypothetical protein|tara:strand:- start:683 stop:1243 length:561 start_codon:yes stop_codon:yes gene_type:complete
MKTIYNIFYGMVAICLMTMATNCGAPPSDKNTAALLDAQSKLERDLKMYEDTWSRFLKGDTAIVNKDRFQEDVVVVTEEGDLVGIEACKNFYMNYLIGFSDIEFTIIDVLGQGDRLVKHWNFKGTHTGEFFGMPASGNKLNLSGTTLVTMKDGKIAREQDFFDVMSMVKQLTAGDVNADGTSPGVL